MENMNFSDYSCTESHISSTLFFMETWDILQFTNKCAAQIRAEGLFQLAVLVQAWVQLSLMLGGSNWISHSLNFGYL
jgi:hypothetical protein